MTTTDSDKEKLKQAIKELRDFMGTQCDRYGNNHAFDAMAMLLGSWSAKDGNPANAFERASAALAHGYAFSLKRRRDAEKGVGE